MDKYKRNYILEVEKKDGQTLRVTLPFTIEFDIERNSLTSANFAVFRVYNLNQNNRSQIRYDFFNYDNIRRVAFRAGYGDKLSLGFLGNISQAFSVREGSNFVTQIECFGGGFAFNNSSTSTTFPSGTTQRSILESMVADLEGVSLGAIGAFDGSTSRANAYDGPTTDLLYQATGGGFFIDNGKAYCMNDDECLSGNILTISPSSGLLGTPLKQETYLSLEMLFEPGVGIYEQIKLESTTADHFNGFHKILSIHHQGTISDAVCGDAKTMLGLLPGVFTEVERSQ